jgi:hypothetical protein
VHTERNGNHDNAMGSRGIAITGTTAWDQGGDSDDSGGQSAPGTMGTGINEGTSERYHLPVPRNYFFISFNFRTLTIVLRVGLQYDLHPEARQQPQHGRRLAGSPHDTMRARGSDGTSETCPSMTKGGGRRGPNRKGL